MQDEREGRSQVSEWHDHELMWDREETDRWVIWGEDDPRGTVSDRVMWAAIRYIERHRVA